MKSPFPFLLFLAHSALAGWVAVPSGTSTYLTEIAVAGSRIFVAGYDGALLRSADSGKTWQTVATGNTYNYTGIAFRDSTTGILLAGKLIFRTTDGGNTWVETPSPDTASRFHDVVFRQGHALMVGGLSGLRVWRSTDAGASWGLPDTAFSRGASTPGAVGRDGGERFCFGASDTGYLAAGRSILKTLNAGATWSLMKEMSVDSDYPATFFLDCGFSTASRVAFTGTYYGHLARTDDGGVSLVQQTALVLSALHFPTPQVGYGAGSIGSTGQRLAKTLDGGLSWSIQDPPPGQSGGMLDVFFLNANVGIAIGTKGLIFRTEDGGGSPVTLSPAPRQTARPRILGLFGRLVDAMGRSLAPE